MFKEILGFNLKKHHRHHCWWERRVLVQLSISGMQIATGLVVLKVKIWHVNCRVRVTAPSCPAVIDPPTKAIAKQASAAVLT